MPAATSDPPPWLVSKAFDGFFIVGVATLGILSSMVVLLGAPFGLVLLLDLWLFGYHHVISTYTRLLMDREVRQTHPFLVYGLPVVIAVLGTALAASLGIWAIATLYLYWQWWHYTRQSWGIAQAYRRRSVGALRESPVLLQAIHYTLPLFCIVHISARGDPNFLGMTVALVPVPAVVWWATACVAVSSIALWSLSRASQALRGTLPFWPTLYTSSHLLIFGVSYIGIDNLTLGWLAINVWHNAQYILFVWLFNTRRFRSDSATEMPLIGRLSQPGNALYYFGFCLLLTTALYLPLQTATRWLTAQGFGLAVVVYSMINFHHYVVDTYIWKLRTPSIQRVLGLNAPPT